MSPATKTTSLLKVTLRVSDLDAARTLLARLTSYRGIEGVSVSEPTRSSASPSKVATPFGPALYVSPCPDNPDQLRWFVGGARRGSEVEFEIRGRQFSLLNLLAKGQHFFSWAELHNALAESDDAWRHLSKDAVRKTYDRLRPTMQAVGWPLLWGEGRYGLNLSA